MSFIGFEGTLYAAITSLFFAVAAHIYGRMGQSRVCTWLLFLGWIVLSLAFTLSAISSGASPVLSRAALLPAIHLCFIAGCTLLVFGEAVRLSHWRTTSSLALRVLGPAADRNSSGQLTAAEKET